MGSNGTVLIVDDDRKVLESLDRLLRLHGYAVQTFASAEMMLSATAERTALRAGGYPNAGIRRDRASVMAFKNPAGAARDLVYWLWRHPQAVRAMKAGAADFLSKPVEERRLLQAIKRAMAQEERLRGEMEARAFHEKGYATLTPREKEVCTLVVEGKLNKQIAAELGTCEKTIKVHRGRVMKKMKVQSLAELVRAVLTTQAPPPAGPPLRKSKPNTSPSGNPRGSAPGSPSAPRS